MPRGRTAAAGGLALAASLLSGSVAEAATFTVTNTSDGGAGSLPNAITQANAYGASHGGIRSSIMFQSGLTGSINLNSELPEITQLVDIYGPGADKLTINGEHAHRIFQIDVTDAGDQSQFAYATGIYGLTLTGGNAGSSPSSGGAVFAQSSVVLSRDTISDSSAADEGGGVFTAPPYHLWVFDSTISGNSAANGGGIYSGGDMYMENSTISGNTADAGGGISEYAGGTAMVASTISGNHATTGPNCGSGCTPAGGGISFAEIPTVRSEWEDTIIAGNTGTVGPDVFIPTGFAVTKDLPQVTFSLIGNTSASRLTTDSTDITGVAPQLGPLADNGGPTPTMLPSDTSPVIDAGNSFGLTTDQRGRTRPIDLPGYPNASGGDGSDIGAVEVQPAEVLPIIHGLSAHTASPGTQIVITGTHLVSARALLFGRISVPFKVDSDNRITTTVPLSTGSVDLRVITRGGESPITGAVVFQFAPVRLRVIRAAFEDLQFKITAPPQAACVAPTSQLPIAFTSSEVAGPKWKLSSVAFYFDRSQQPVQRLDGDGSVRLAVRGLAPGNHTLRVAATAALGTQRHTTTVPVAFVVC